MNPKRSNLRLLFILAVCLSVIGCLTLHAAETKTPEEVEWTLVELNGKPVAAPEKGGAPTLRFDAEKKKVNGFAGVNRFFGGYERDGDKVKFGPQGATRMSGSPEAMAAETAYLAALTSITHWRITDGSLHLLKEDKTIAR